MMGSKLIKIMVKSLYFIDVDMFWLVVVYYFVLVNFVNSKVYYKGLFE